MTFSCYHTMITWTYLKAWRKHDIEVHFELHEVQAVFQEEKLHILFLCHFFYICLLEDSYWYKEKKMHTQNNVQSLVKLDLKFVNARSFFMTVIYELKTSGKFPLRYIVMLCYFVYIKMMNIQYLYSLLPNWWGRGDWWIFGGKGYNSWGL